MKPPNYMTKSTPPFKRPTNAKLSVPKHSQISIKRKPEVLGYSRVCYFGTTKSRCKQTIFGSSCLQVYQRGLRSQSWGRSRVRMPEILFGPNDVSRGVFTSLDLSCF